MFFPVLAYSVRNLFFDLFAEIRRNNISQHSPTPGAPRWKLMRGLVGVRIRAIFLEALEQVILGGNRHKG